MVVGPLDHDAVCVVRDLHHRYGAHQALGTHRADGGFDQDLSRGEITALLGPNGSGKTTLFRLLCTLMPIQRGTVSIAGIDIARDPLAARARLGIVFQSPSLDVKLTVDENLACQAALYGLKGDAFRVRCDELLRRLRLTDRRGDRCETLSGGLKRRVELVKGMLHRPPLLLLDEPSTGLDPAARIQFWESLRALADEGVAVLLTTHLLEEADKADRVVIMSAGRKLAEGAPAELRAALGGGIVSIVASDAGFVARTLQSNLRLDHQRIGDQFRIQSATPAALLPDLVEQLGGAAQSITVGQPTLEDVFIAHAGREFVEVTP